MSVLYKGDIRRQQKWQELFAKNAPDIPFITGEELDSPEKVKYLLAWNYTSELLESLPNLEVFFALGAGVDQFDLSDFPENVSLVRMVEPGIIDGMVEYATFATLTLHRDMLSYIESQNETKWKPIQTTLASNRRVGVMGLGSLGQSVINRLKPFGFPMFGWSRSAHDIDGVTCYSGADGLPEFLLNCDILICLVPLTPETKYILNKSLFDQLPPGAGIINVGRGGHLVEEDLIAALDNGQLSGAVVDVIEAEPAAPDHPFWKHPKIFMTPHIASMTIPESAARVVIDNIMKYQNGQLMIGEVERAKGY